MKIYSKSCFITGILCLCPLPLYALGVIPARGWYWVLSIAFAAKFLYAALSRSEHLRQQRLTRRWNPVSRELLGPMAALKLNLPWVIAGIFFAAALVIRLGFDIVIPAWVLVVFALVLTVSVFYSIGLNQSVTDRIDEEPEEDSTP